MSETDRQVRFREEPSLGCRCCAGKTILQRHNEQEDTGSG